jgi:hypothetical protein
MSSAASLTAGPRGTGPASLTMASEPAPCSKVAGSPPSPSVAERSSGRTRVSVGPPGSAPGRAESPAGPESADCWTSRSAYGATPRGDPTAAFFMDRGPCARRLSKSPVGRPNPRPLRWAGQPRTCLLGRIAPRSSFTGSNGQDPRNLVLRRAPLPPSPARAPRPGASSPDAVEASRRAVKSSRPPLADALRATRRRLPSVSRPATHDVTPPAAHDAAPSP